MSTKLTTVHLNDFRGGKLGVNLSGVDIITGPNGIGKTRILQAVQLALTGAVPHPIEERNIELNELFTKSLGQVEMGVEAVFDDGMPRVERKFSLSSKNAKDSIKQTVVVNGIPKGVNEASEEITALLGDFPVMFDIHRFIRLSDNARADMILKFSPVDPAKWNADAIIERLSKIFPQLQAVNGEALEVVKVLRGHIKGDPRGAIENATAYLKAVESQYKKEVKNNQGAAIANVEMNVADGTKPLREASAIKEELDLLRKQIEELNAVILQSANTKKAWEANEREKATLSEDIKRYSELASKEVLAAIERDITARLSRIIEVDPTAYGKVDEKKATLKALAEERDGLNIQMAVLQSFITGFVEMIRKVKDHGDTCPTCGQGASGVVGRWNEDLAKAAALLESEQAKHAEIDRKAKLLEAEINGIEGELHNIVRSNEAITREIHSLEKELAEKKAHATALANYESRYAELSYKKFDISANVAEAELQLEGLRSRIAQVEAEQTEKIRYDQMVIAAKTSALKAKQATESLDFAKAAAKELNEIKWAVITDALGVIEKEAAALFALTGEANVVFSFQLKDARGNEAFKFGWKKQTLFGDMFIDFDSLSTSQQIFTIVSLLAPMINRANPKYRVLILDNCEVIDESRRIKFCDLLIAAHKTMLDNIIIASSSPYPRHAGLVKGVTLHELGSEKMEAAA